MTHKRIQIFTFGLIMLVVIVLVAMVLWPNLTLLAFGGIASVVMRPVFRRVRRNVKSDHWAALIATLVLFFILALPVWLFGQLLFNEISDTYHRFQSGEIAISRDGVVQLLPTQLQSAFESFTADFNNFVSRYTSNAFQAVSHFVSNVANFIFSFFLFLFSVYYFLKDGTKIKEILMDLSPIAASQENILFSKITNSIRGVVFGTFLVAIIQGLLATLGFLVFGIPNALLWGSLTILAAVIPTIGTAIILIPAVLFLFATHNTGAAIGLAIWGGLAVGTIDNILSPKLVGRTAQLHPLLVLFSVIGGLQFFGFLGFLLGPILMAVFTALVNMYRTDFQKFIE